VAGEPPVGVVFVEVRPDFTAFEAELTAKLKAISAVGVPGGAAAGVSKLGKATSSTTSTISKQTKAIEGEVEALSHFQRGLAATTLSSFGLRGATLAATGPFLAGAAIVTVFAKALHAASAEEEAAAKITKVFGQAIASDLDENAKKLAGTFGLSTAQAEKFEGSIGNLLSNVGVTGQRAADLSENVIKLAADLAAFNNVPVDKTLRAIQIALSGNSRGLKVYGVELNQARVNAEALALSGKENTKQLTQQDIVLARLHLIFQQTNNAQGAAERRAKGLAQGTRNLSAELENLGGTIGKLVQGPFSGLIHDLSDTVGLFQKAGDAATNFGHKADQATQGKKGGIFSDIRKLATLSLPDLLKVGPNAARDLGKELAGGDIRAKELSDTMEELHKAAEDAFNTGNPRAYGKALLDLTNNAHDDAVAFDFLHQHAERAFERKSIDNFIDALQKAVFTASRLAQQLAGRAFRAAGNQLSTLQDAAVQTTIETGNERALLPNLARQEAAARAKLRAAQIRNRLAGGRSQARLQDVRDARQELAAIVQQERAINKDIVDAAKNAADERKAAAEKAKADAEKKLADADSALLAAFGLAEGNVGLAAITAEASKGLDDDIAAQIKLQALLQKEIAEAAKINDGLLRRQTVLDKRTQLLQSQNTVRELQEEQRQRAIQARQDVLDKQKESLQLDIDIAQTQKNKKKELAAHQALLAWLTERLNHYRRNTVQWKQLILEINQERAAIAELKKASQKRADDLKVAEFQFLQEQQGFVGRLLGNLLPFGAVAGTVGDVGITTQTGTPGGSGGTVVPSADFARAAHQRPVGSLTSATQGGKGPHGATMGQASVQITLLRSILRALIHISGQRTHPEAATSKAQQAVAFDIF